MSLFYTPELRAWLGGHEPIIAKEMAEDKKAKAAKADSQRQAMARMEIGGDALKGWGRGTIAGGLSPKRDPGKAGRIRKPSGL